jgi:hypothetical protein
LITLSCQLYLSLSPHPLLQNTLATSPVVVDCFDDEAKCWRDCVNVLAHNVLDYRSLAAIVKSTKQRQSAILLVKHWGSGR